MATWILVSDASRAVVYQTERRGDAWTIAAVYSHPESRLKDSELSPTEPGHAAQSKGGPRRTAFSPTTAPKEVETEHFAQQLADALHHAGQTRSLDRLALVAPPHFLGLLRAKLSAETAKLVVASIDKDYTELDPEGTRRRLEDAVFD